VNVKAENPEIGTRAFSSDATVCAEYALRMYEGIRDGGVVATAKHFPGRGDSTKDAHEELECINVDRATMLARELTPYKRLIAGGLGAIMSAHSAYPSLDSADTPATLSSRILRDLLRGELGFTGVITSDAMGMGAIIKRWGIPRACVLAVKAGCNLLLVKNDEEVRTQSFYALKQAVEKGEVSEEELEESVRYVLGMKYDQGLFTDGGVADTRAAARTVGSAAHRTVEAEACRKAAVLIRDRVQTLPLKPKQKVLVIEQIVPLEFTPNDTNCNSHVFNEAMIEQSRNVVNATSEFCATEQETALLLEVAKEADVVVVTNHYWRIRPKNNAELVKKLLAAGNKVVVLTNTPYEVGATAEAPCVLCTLSATPQSLRHAAAVLYGKARTEGTLPAY
jgi:beta-N-acetylhexosaminidase